MSDPVAAVKAAEATVVADVQKEVAVVKTTWLTKVRPWLTHAGALIAGYLAANPSSLGSIVAGFFKGLWNLL